MLGNLLAGAGATALLLAAGLAAALTWRPGTEEEPGPLGHLLLALGVGFGLVPYLAFLYPLLAKQPLTATITLAAAMLVLFASLGVWWFRGRVIPIQLRRGWRAAIPVLVACAMVAALYVLRYDRSIFSDSTCLVRLVYDTLHLTAEPVDLMLSEQDDQRLGNTAVIAGFVSVYGVLGFRLLFGFAAFATALGGFVLGRRALGSDAWGWFVLVVLTLNPYLLRLPLLDENLLALGFSALVLPLLLHRRVPWLHVGLLLGLVLMMRHALVLSLPAVAWVLWRQQTARSRAVLEFVAALTAVTWVAHVHHLLAYGSVFTFESFGQIPAVPHRFVGSYSGLLQWPFGDELVRTPWNPFPTFLMWPVYLAGHFGLVLFAAMIVGLVDQLLSREHRDGSVFWLLWFAPTYVALSLQEHWDVPNKMGVIYILLIPLVLWAGAGLQAAWRSPLRWGLGWLGVMLISGVALLGLRGLDVQPDGRYLAIWAGERPEESRYVDALRREVTRPTPWPQFSRAATFAPLIDDRTLDVLAADLLDPDPSRPLAPYGWYPGDAVDAEGAAVTVSLDMGDRPHERRGPWVVAGQGDPDIDLTVFGPPRVITGIEVDWLDRPVTVMTSRGRAGVTSLMLVFEPLYDTDDTALLLDHYDRALALILGWEREDFDTVEVVRHRDAVLTVRVLPGPLSATETLNNAGHIFLTWRGVARDAPEMSGPKLVFHN
jgi:hypothetical protein